MLHLTNKNKYKQMKIAITSSDGEYIDSHFGKADKVLIYELNDKGSKLIEIRNFLPYSSGEPNHAFNQSKFDLIYSTLKDCSMLYTLKIGEIVADKFLEKGIVTKISDSRIDKILNVS